MRGSQIAWHKFFPSVSQSSTVQVWWLCVGYPFNFWNSSLIVPSVFLHYAMTERVVEGGWVFLLLLLFLSCLCQSLFLSFPLSLSPSPHPSFLSLSLSLSLSLTLSLSCSLSLSLSLTLSLSCSLSLSDSLSLLLSLSGSGSLSLSLWLSGFPVVDKGSVANSDFLQRPTRSSVTQPVHDLCTEWL